MLHFGRHHEPEDCEKLLLTLHYERQQQSDSFVWFGPNVSSDREREERR